jgi:hypothetical protein
MEKSLHGSREVWENIVLIHADSIAETQAGNAVAVRRARQYKLPRMDLPSVGYLLPEPIGTPAALRRLPIDSAQVRRGLRAAHGIIWWALPASDRLRSVRGA